MSLWRDWPVISAASTRITTVPYPSATNAASKWSTVGAGTFSRTTHLGRSPPTTARKYPARSGCLEPPLLEEFPQSRICFTQPLELEPRFFKAIFNRTDSRKDATSIHYRFTSAISNGVTLCPPAAAPRSAPPVFLPDWRGYCSHCECTDHSRNAIGHAAGSASHSTHRCGAGRFPEGVCKLGRPSRPHLPRRLPYFQILGPFREWDRLAALTALLDVHRDPEFPALLHHRADRIVG
jgi:hypothetical protein